MSQCVFKKNLFITPKDIVNCISSDHSRKGRKTKLYHMSGYGSDNIQTLEEKTGRDTQEP